MRLTILTSISPNPDREERQRRCLSTWTALGARLIAVQADNEGDVLPGAADDVIVSSDEHGPPRLGALLQVAEGIVGHVLLLNSDLEALPALARLPALADEVGGGCLFLVRHNYDSTEQPEFARAEAWGIDGFFLRADGHSPGRLFADSSLRIGRPCWDYALPYAYLMRGRQLYTVDDRVLLHANHDGYWSEDDWQVGAKEMCRLLGLAPWEPLQQGMMAISNSLREKSKRLQLPSA
jgi:hypothetical protein